MERYTIDQAAQSLGVSPKTLRLWMKAQDIVPVLESADRRYHLLSAVEVEQLRQAHHDQRPARYDELLARIDTLEQRIAALEATRAPRPLDPLPLVSYIPVVSDASPMRSQRGGVQRNRRITATPDMPDHLIGLSQFCAVHGVAATTAKKQWHDQGVFQVEGPYKIGRVAQAWAIDHENALRALHFWFDDGERDATMIGHCGLEGCPCAALLS